MEDTIRNLNPTDRDVRENLMMEVAGVLVSGEFQAVCILVLDSEGLVTSTFEGTNAEMESLLHKGGESLRLVKEQQLKLVK